MDNIIKQLKKGAKHTRLSYTEKTEMKSKLLRYVRVNPTNIQRAIPSPFNINNFRNKRATSILVIAGLLLGSTVSFAAEGTAPGDILYPVKVHVNESVRSAIAITPTAKADWEIQLAERRLKEMEKLAIETNVSPEVKILAEQNFNASSERVKSRISKLEEGNDKEDALNTAGTFRDMLRKHEEEIDNFDNHTKETKSLDALNVQNVATTSVRNENKEESLKDVREKLRDTRDEVEKKHEELKKKYNKEKDKRNDEVKASQNNSLKEKKRIEIDMNKGKSKGEEIRSSDEQKIENKGEKE